MIKFMKLAIGLALVGAWTNSVAAEDKVDLTGTWVVTIEIAGQTGAPEFTFKHKGDKLTGKYKGQFGEADVTGKVDGSKVMYTGKIKNDVMKGKADYAGQATGEWTAKRKKADE